MQTKNTNKNKLNSSAKEFGKRLQSLIKEKKITQTDLVEQTKTNKSTVSQWVNGQVKAGPKNNRMLAEFFGCDETWLATGRGEKIPENLTETPLGTKGQAGSVPLITESETLVLRAYRELARMDADFLLEVHAWLKEEDSKRPGFSSWFRLEFANRFPEFAEWQEKISKKVA